MAFLCTTTSSAGQSTGISAQNNLEKCGMRTKEFSASVVAMFSLGNKILMTVGFSQWLVSPPDRILTLFQASLVLESME